MRKVIIMFFLTLFSLTTTVKAEPILKLNDEFASNVEQLPGKLFTWLGNEVTKTKEYQKKVWSESKLFKTKKN